MLESLLALSAVCKVLTETILGGIKARFTTTDADGVKYSAISDELMAWLSLVVSLIVAVLANEVAGLNLLASTSVGTRVSPDVAIIFTGVAIGFGSNVVNEIFGVLEGWKDRSNNPQASATATVTTVSDGGAIPTATASASGKKS